jgi:hypothetical protein
MNASYFTQLKKTISLEELQLEGAGNVITTLPEVPTHTPQDISNTSETSPSSDDAPITEGELENVALIIAKFSEAQSAVTDYSNKLNNAFQLTVAMEDMLIKHDPKDVYGEHKWLDHLPSPGDILGIGLERIESDSGEVLFSGCANPLPLPSLEAYKANPTVAMESISESFRHGLETVWTYMRALFVKLLEKLRAYWKWATGIFAIRRKRLQEAKVVAKDIASHATTEQKTAVDHIPMILGKREIYALWHNGKANISTDIARDMQKLAAMYGNLQGHCEETTIAWGKELLDSLADAANKVGTLDIDGMTTLLQSWNTEFNAKVAKHENTVASKAASYVGDYIGCIHVKAEPLPFDITMPVGAPHHINAKFPSPHELQEIVDSALSLDMAVSSMVTEYRAKTESEINRFVKEIDSIIKQKLSKGLHVVKFRKTFQGHLGRFQNRFNSAQTKNNAVTNRVQDILGTVGGIVVTTKKAYLKVGIDLNS